MPGYAARGKGLAAKCFSRIIVALLLILPASVLFFRAEASASSPAGSRGQEVMVAWTADNGRGEQVYFSSFDKDGWTSPVQVSDAQSLVFQPVAATGSDGRVWMVWSQQDRDGSHLQYSVRSGDRWELPRPIDTGMDVNTAATLVVDRHNTPWLAWTGEEGTYPDVFWTRWNGRDWDAPVKAHQGNDVPDLGPSLALDETGKVLLAWRSFAKGRYATVTKVWDGKEWTAALHDTVTTRRKDSADFARQEIKEGPGFVPDSRKATLHIKYNGGACSLLLSQF